MSVDRPLRDLLSPASRSWPTVPLCFLQSLRIDFPENLVLPLWFPLFPVPTRRGLRQVDLRLAHLREGHIRTGRSVGQYPAGHRDHAPDTVFQVLATRLTNSNILSALAFVYRIAAQRIVPVDLGASSASSTLQFLVLLAAIRFCSVASLCSSSSIPFMAFILMSVFILPQMAS